VRHVVHAVWRRAPLPGNQEIMHPNFYRLPFGLHIWPPFLKSPTSSFFFVSTEITGCLRPMYCFTFALICSNGALRSGCRPPLPFRRAAF